MNLPMPKDIVCGITIIHTPIILIQSASMILFLRPKRFRAPLSKAPMKPPMYIIAVIRGIKEDSDEPQPSEDDTQG